MLLHVLTRNREGRTWLAKVSFCLALSLLGNRQVHPGLNSFLPGTQPRGVRWRCFYWDSGSLSLQGENIWTSSFPTSDMLSGMSARIVRPRFLSQPWESEDNRWMGAWRRWHWSWHGTARPWHFFGQLGEHKPVFVIVFSEKLLFNFFPLSNRVIYYKNTVFIQHGAFFFVLC